MIENNNDKICFRVFNVYGKNMIQFYKLIYLKFVPNVNSIMVIENKSYVVKHVIIQYNENETGVDLYIEKNKNENIEDLISQKNTLFPTHLWNQDSLS